MFFGLGLVQACILAFAVLFAFLDPFDVNQKDQSVVVVNGSRPAEWFFQLVPWLLLVIFFSAALVFRRMAKRR